MAGPTLQQLMAQEDLTLQQADALVQGLLRGVAAAHAHGLVHRDLKPANVMIAVTESALVPKIADFGLAKVLQREQTSMQATQSGLAMGTPAYMAPEQIQDSSSVDARADVFALGAILYEIVSGARCFTEEKLLNLWQDICLGRYTPLDERTPGLPPRILKAVEGALALDREDRIPSVNSLMDVWFEGVTESVDLSPSKSQQVWPQAIRDKTASMASKVTQVVEAPSKDSVSLEQTLAAGPSPPTATPTSVTMRPGEVQTTAAPAPRETPRGVWFVGVALLIGGAWLAGRQTPSAQTDSPASEPATAQAGAGDSGSQGAGDASASTEIAAAPRGLFTLSSGQPESAQERLEKALDAILEGENARAERL
ncbi:MAG: serine/threonine-protein kinase, partial [Myxococcota bacterium]|nr:serine/threonine-protein kinase [Myxococcota bacterium]